MNSNLDALRRAARAASIAANTRDRDPLAAVEWLPFQEKWLRDPRRRKLLRTCQQGGKTWTGLAESIWRCLGRHPFYATKKPPVTGWLLCASWQQSIEIQKKLWGLVPKHEVDPRCTFDPVRGFSGHHPALRFRNGSIIYIRTTQQGSMALAGATLDFAMFDEVPWDELVYNEVDARLRRSRGTMLLTLTPIGRPVEWLQKLCEEDVIADHHFRLTPDLFTLPSGRVLTAGDGTPLDAEWIAELRKSTPDYLQPCVLDAEWETRVQGRRFAAFQSSGAESHVHDRATSGDVLVCLGIDHGSAAGKQAAVLIYVDEKADPGGHPSIWIVDEYRPAKATTPEDDALEILAMLKRHKLAWDACDYVYGDRPVGSKGAIDRKGNLDLEDVIRKRLGLRRREDLKPRIRTSKAGVGNHFGSVDLGVRWLHFQMLRAGKFNVHTRCRNVVESFEQWEGDKNDPLKDLPDAIRYALRPWIFGERSRPGPGPKIRVG